MSVKKILMLAAAGLASTSVLADGMANYAASANDQTGLYVGINAGWAQLDWKNQLGTASPGASWNTAGSTGGFVGGLDIGYSFNQYLALELGGFWLPNNAKYNDDVSSVVDTFKTWDIYLAAKATAALYEAVNVFGKLGLAYTQTNISSTAAYAFPSSVATGNHSSWRPLFAAGLGYDFAEDWNLNAQYALILGRQSNGTTYSANQNIYTLGLAYTFAM